MVSIASRKIYRARTFILLGVLFLGLGAGNIWYGSKRNDRYQTLVTEAEANLSDPETNREQQIRYVRRLRARIVFYNTVETGGRLMVGVALLAIGVGFALYGPGSNGETQTRVRLRE